MKKTLLVISMLVASTALAHEGVKNPAVKARMDGMSAIAENMKTLSLMFKEDVAFDLENAQLSLSKIANHAAQTPALFEAKEDDPKSEAKDEIWSNFEDFSNEALTLEAIALKLSTSINSSEDLGPALRELGASCKACHSMYRE